MKEWTPCDVCMILKNTNDPNKAMGAAATHEVFYGGDSYMRNMSIKYNAQVKACEEHHRLLHDEENGEVAKILQQIYKKKIMKENKWTEEQFYKVFKKYYREVEQ